MEVGGEICTVELPETEVKKWWEKDDWKVFVQEFQERHPTAKTIAKDMPKKETSPTTSSTLVKVPRKRQADVDLTKHVVDEGCAPGQTKICTVPIINGRFPTNVKCQDLPVLVVSDGGPYVLNSTGHPVPYPTYVCLHLQANTIQYLLFPSTK